MIKGTNRYQPSHARKRNKRSKAAKKRWECEKNKDVNVNSIPPATSPPLIVMKPTKTYINVNKIIPVDSIVKPVSTIPIATSDHESRNTEECNVFTNTSNFSFIQSIEEIESIENHELCIEKVKTQSILDGNRIVDLNYLLSWALPMQSNHNKNCTSGMLIPISETRNGLVSNITFACNICNVTYNYSTEPPALKSKINIGAVWGTLASGSTYAHLQEILAVLDIPAMSYHQFSNIEDELGNEWHDTLWKSMEEAGKEEKQIAIDANRIHNGIPWITVYVDGGWSKRSYGHNYTAASGVGVIIGKATGKVLFIGVRNKYCSACARAANQKVLPKNHVCFRNWEGSSPAMEADIIAEGFAKSEEMHGVRYLKLIADGDSSVFARIRDKVSYGEYVQKTECKNHAVKNYGKALHQIKKDTNIHVFRKKFLTNAVIHNMQKVCQVVINANCIDKNIDKLKEDIRNSQLHVFGDHTKCQSYFCDGPPFSENLVQQLKDTGIYNHIFGALESILRKADRLIDNENNNRAETYMSVVARFVGGKRINFSQKGGYTRRSELAGLRSNKGVRWSISPWKKITGSSPGKNFSLYLERYMRSQERRNARRKLTFEENKENRVCSKKPRIYKKPLEKNTDYGNNADDVPLDEDEYKSACTRILDSMKCTPEEIKSISTATIGQFQNNVYTSYRKNRLTASNFGMVIKRRQSTKCHNQVKQILYPPFIQTPALEYGKQKESVAIQIFQKLKNVIVEPSGLFIDKDHPYLAASPDGLIGEEELVEVKCLFSVYSKGISLFDAVSQMKNLCISNNHGKLELKRNHNYYYQIQGQLNITGRKKCYLIIYVGDDHDLFIEEINIDKDFWNQSMLPKLKKFYEDCVLPEIVLGKIKKGSSCVDPSYINKPI